MSTARDWYTAELATAYDRRNPTIRPGLRAAAAWLADAVPDGAVVVDLGCGAGRDLPHLARSGTRVVGVDVAMPMLEIARRRHPALLCADLTRLPLPDATAHAVWCVATWVHVGRRDLPHAAVELARVLRPGGIAVIGLHRGSGESFDLDPYIGRRRRLMVRYQEDEVHAVVRDAGMRPLTLALDGADLDGWITLIVVKPWAVG